MKLAVIERKDDLDSRERDVNFNLIDLSEDDVFKKVSDLLNHWFSVGYAIYNSFLNRDFVDGVRILFAKLNFIEDRYMELGV